MRKKMTRKQKVIGLLCTCVGLALAGFGIGYMTKPRYAGGDVSVKEIPQSRVDDDVYLVK